MIKSFGLYLIVLISTEMLSAHSIETHKKITKAAVDYLRSTGELSDTCSPNLEALLQFGTEHEDDSPRFMFHFFPALQTTLFYSKCSSFEWGFGNSPCTESGYPADQPTLANSHTWNTVLSETGGDSKGWIELGFVIHLLEDLTSPAHSRNDPHPHVRIAGVKIGNPDPIEAEPPDGRQPDQISETDVPNISTPQYFFASLQEYVEHNFYSKDRVFQQGLRWIGPEARAEDAQYFYDERSRKIAFKGLRYNLSGGDPSAATIDSDIANDQWKELGPLAVGYVAGRAVQF